MAEDKRTETMIAQEDGKEAAEVACRGNQNSITRPPRLRA